MLLNELACQLDDGRVYDPASRSRPTAGSEIVTTVPSMNAMPDPRTVASSTQRPAAQR